ncbi:MAG: GAF domain-containing protein [Armatimonadetes bacterium]|nr:GAF domain-containing protein [Armatimonadota bacterium]MDW8121359.1 GAF domain-containing protein [Armatimonadota bacterium]
MGTRVKRMAHGDTRLTDKRELALERLGRFLGALSDTEVLLKVTLEEGLAAVQATRGTISLIDHRTGTLVMKYAAGAGWTEEKRAIPLKVTEEPGGSISGYVALTGQPYIARDVTQDPHYYPLFSDTRSELAVPLTGRGGKVIGVLNAEKEMPDAFGEQDARVLMAVATLAAVALTLADYRRREQALIDVGRDLSAATDVEEVLQRIAETAASVLDADDCSLFLMDESLNRLILKASKGPLKDQIGHASYRVGEGLTGWVFMTGQPLRLNGVQADPRWKGLYTELEPEQISAFLAVPVKGRSGTWGVLRVVRKKPESERALEKLFDEEDERLLSLLASQVGGALERERMQERLFRAERLAAIGELAARGAHMIGNKIFALKGAIKTLKTLITGPDSEKLFQAVERAIYETEVLLQELRDFVKATHLTLNPVCLNDLISEVLEEQSRRLSHIRFQADMPEAKVWIKGDQGKFRSVLEELIENSRQCLGDFGEIKVILTVDRHPQESRRVRVIVLDNGPGVPEELKEKIFEPFFTSRPKGIGLGLATVKGIVEAHGGTVEERGRPGEGAKFIISLPLLTETKEGND